MPMTINRHEQLLDDFISRLNQEKFYDAHESLEQIWFPRRFEDCDEIRLLKGFINAAISFELIKRGRPDSSKRVWKTYLKYKPLLHQINSKYLPEYHSIVIHVEKIKRKLDINHLGV